MLSGEHTKKLNVSHVMIVFPVSGVSRFTFWSHIDGNRSRSTEKNTGEPIESFLNLSTNRDSAQSSSLPIAAKHREKYK